MLKKIKKNIIIFLNRMEINLADVLSVVNFSYGEEFCLFEEAD